MEEFNRESFIRTLNAAVNRLGIQKKAITISHDGASMLLGLRETIQYANVLLAATTFDALKHTGKYTIATVEAAGWLGELEYIMFMDVAFFRHPTGMNLYPYDYRNAVDGYDVTAPLQLLVDRIARGLTSDLDDILRLRTIWIHLPDMYKDRLSQLLDNAGIIK